jgi:hypothetical protein
MKKTYLLALSLLTGFLFLCSCKKKFDLPAKKDIPVSGYITIDSIYKRFITYYQGTGPAPTRLYRFNTDVNLECLVTADETSGNIYKTVYVEDATGGLQIKLINTGGLYAGDKIRINLNNIVLDNYGNTVQLDSIDIYKHVAKISSGNIVTPIKLTMAQAKATTTGSFLKYQSRLITLDTVEFYGANKNVVYADAIGKYSLDRYIVNAAGNSMDVRTSGYSKFAGNITPCGTGAMTAILTEYNGTPQLTIRDLKEVKMSNGNCPYIAKGFDNEPSVLYGGWTMQNVIGTTNWTIDTYNGQIYGYISNYANSSNQLCETWLISPAMNLTGAPNPRMTFQSAYNYAGPALQVMVSTNYNSGNPNLATWTALSPTMSGGSWAWAPSGNVSLSSYISSNTHIAFKYSGTATSGSTWEIDDIVVFPQ